MNKSNNNLANTPSQGIKAYSYIQKAVKKVQFDIKVHQKQNRLKQVKI